MQSVLSKHWNTTLTHGIKFFNVKQCIANKLGGIMQNYD